MKRFLQLWAKNEHWVDLVFFVVAVVYPLLFSRAYPVNVGTLCLMTGKHVLREKPMVSNPEQCHRIGLTTYMLGDEAEEVFLAANTLAKAMSDGAEGTIETYAGRYGVVLHKRNGERVYYDIGRIPGHYEPPLAKIVDIFAKRVLEGTRPLCASREGLHCLEVINAAYKSLETKTWTKVGEE